MRLFRKTLTATDTLRFKGLYGADCCALALAVILCFTLGYHPFFFGDEATVFREIGIASGVFDSTLALSQYKPRLLFNSIWASGVHFELPRWYYAAVAASSMLVACLGLCLVARRWFGATRVQLWLLVTLVLGSRFGPMLYFDYVAGIIECLSFALFIWSFYLFDSVRTRGSKSVAILSLMLGVLSVLVHERYMIAIFAAAFATVVAHHFFSCGKGRPLTKRWLGFAAVYAVLPGIVFILLNFGIGGRSLSTGTAGAEVSIGWGTVETFITYFANVFLGTHFGHEWFVGAPIFNGRRMLVFTVLSIVLLSGLWILWLRGMDRNLRGRAVQIFVVILALMAVASLPGLERQEARWMFPVSSLVAVLILANPAPLVRSALLSVLLTISAAGWVSGSYGAIYNVYESRTANALGRGFDGLAPPGNTALLLDADNSAWALGLIGGVDIFSKVNARQRMHIDLYDADRPVEICNYDFGIIRYGATETGVGKFAQLDINELVSIVSARNYQNSDSPKHFERCARGGMDFGHGTSWPEWSWSGKFESVAEGVILGPASLVVGRREVGVEELDRKVLTYFARTAQQGTSSNFRLQVNWTSSHGEFLGTSIKVVKVVDRLAPYSLYLVAPKDAAFGEIYSNLHDGETRRVILQRVSVE